MKELLIEAIRGTELNDNDKTWCKIFLSHDSDDSDVRDRVTKITDIEEVALLIKYLILYNTDSRQRVFERLVSRFNKLTMLKPIDFWKDALAAGAKRASKIIKPPSKKNERAIK